MLGRSIRRAYHRQPLTPISEIKTELAKLSGGSIKLSKNERSGIAELVLNYPESYNALTGSMMAELDETLEELGTWKTGKGILLSGAKNPANYFCSGGHLSTVKSGDSPEKGFRMSVLMNHVSRKLQNLPLVTVSVLEGPALGGGAELATTTDHRLATSSAFVAFVQTKMGLCTGFGGGGLLVNLVGYNRALDLIISGRKLRTEEGLRLGYFDAEVSEGRGVEDGLEWLERRTKHCTPLVIKNTKAVLRQGLSIPDEYKGISSDEYESRLFAELWYGEAHRTALGQNIKHK